jgi:phosphoglycerate dehydrogenase-like enzyme
MESMNTTWCRRRVGLALAVMVVASVAAATESPPAAARLPDGLVVKVDAETGSNRVLIRIGGDVLAVDTGGQPTEGGAAPRYRLLTGAPEAEAAGGGGLHLWPAGRSDHLAPPDGAAVVFDSRLELSAAGREVVVLDLGRGLTSGDAAVWLPSDGVLVTGDLCSEGRVAATADSDTRAWIRSLEKLRDLGPELVVPGRGPVGGPELLDAEIERLMALRAAAESALLEGLSADRAAAALTDPWFEAWRQRSPEQASAAFEAVYDEVGGLRPPPELIEDRGLREGPSPTRQDPNWAPPRRVLWRNLWPERLQMLARVAPGVVIVPFDSTADALGHVADADALIGAATPELLAAGSRLRWVQVGSAGVERYLEIPELASGAVLLTNGQRLASPEIAEHVMALTRALSRNLRQAVLAQAAGQWRRSELGSSELNRRLRGKTMLVVGLGGIGTEVARLAHAAGMRVTAIRSSRRWGPPFVAKVGLTEDLEAWLAEADVVVNCLPLTEATARVFDAEMFEAMRDDALFINVGRGGTVDTDALIEALVEGRIAGAGLDVTDPEPLPDGHPLWEAPNLIITPHYSAWSDVGRERRWLLYRENLRRFSAGEPLLSVVDPERGY